MREKECMHAKSLQSEGEGILEYKLVLSSRVDLIS